VVVFALRCTRKLLRQLHVAPADVVPAPTTILGDWYANILFYRPHHVVLCVSERTLLPVLVASAPLKTFAPRMRDAAVELLRAIEVPEERIEAEAAQMETAILTTTDNKTVVGSMNDFSRALDHYMGSGLSLPAIARRLADTPCGPLDMGSPDRMTRACMR
jgi:hypothetical protein